MTVVRKLDPTRPITAGITHMHLANESGFASLLDVTGYNGGGGIKIGPEMGFAITMQEYTKEPILIIKTTWGGKSLLLDFRPQGPGDRIQGKRGCRQQHGCHE